MLERDVDKRINAKEIFEHPWMNFFKSPTYRKLGTYKRALTRIGPKEFSGAATLVGFCSNSTPHLYRICMLYLANKIEDSSWKTFVKMDANHDGVINKEEFKSFLNKTVKIINSSIANKLFEQID